MVASKSHSKSEIKSGGKGEVNGDGKKSGPPKPKAARASRQMKPSLKKRR